MRKFKKELTKRLEEKDFIVNCIKVKGYNKETGNIKSITISIEDYDIGVNAVPVIKGILDSVEEEFNVSILEKLLDF